MAVTMHRERIRMSLDGVEIDAVLSLPEEALGVVVLASAGASAQSGLVNDYLAAALRAGRLATASIDLLQAHEAGDVSRFAQALPDRLGRACTWIGEYAATEDLPIGVFGVGEAGAAALMLAAGRPPYICAVAARGARIAPAESGAMAKIAVPTLLIASGLDEESVTASRGMYAALRCKKRLEIVPGATLDFGEPGSPEVLARAARSWFLQHARFAGVVAIGANHCLDG